MENILRITEIMYKSTETYLVIGTLDIINSILEEIRDGIPKGSSGVIKESVRILISLKIGYLIPKKTFTEKI